MRLEKSYPFGSKEYTKEQKMQSIHFKRDKLVSDNKVSPVTL